MPDLDRIAREIADQRWLDTFEKHALAKDILAALRRVEAETREECARKADEWAEARLDEANAPIISGDIFRSDAVFVDSTANAFAGYRLTDLAAAIRTSKEGEA